MSVHALRARIEELSTEIDLQKELLKKLELDKSLLQCDLNAVLDPIARLPLEISSDIFLRCLPPFPEPGTRYFPMLFLHVCSAWTNIALSTPALWAAVRIAFPCAEGFKEGLQAWLRRAGNNPLSICLHGTPDQNVVSVVWRHSRQVEHLEISDKKSSDEYIIDFVLSGVDLGPLPLLETLTIRHIRGKFPGPQLLDLLRRAPNLKECHFQGMQVSDLQEITAEKLVLPALRRLRFGECGDYPNSHPGILTYLSLPALETLSLSLIKVDFFSFLERSLPPLQELVIAGGLTSPVLRLPECLHLIPTLTSFEGWILTPDLLAELLTVLADSPSLLPTLHILKIVYLSPFDDPSSDFDPSWRRLLRVLLSRRTQLRSVHFRAERNRKPAPDILAAFRELVVDGMQIHVRSCGQNYLLGADV